MNAAAWRLAAACVFFLTAFSQARAGDEGGGPSAAERAREALARRLEAARTDGVISVREPLAQPPAQTAPALRSSEPAACISIESLSRTYDRLGAEKAAALDALRRELLASADENHVDIEIELARAYLSLGFTAEASAIASAGTGVEAAAIVALARIAEGDSVHFNKSAAAFEFCGALFDLASDIATALASDEPALTERSKSTLLRLPPPLRQALIDGLAVKSLHFDLGAAQDLGEIGGETALGPTSEAGRLVGAITGKNGRAASDKALIAFAATPGAYREAALEALQSRTTPDGLDRRYAGFEDDIEEAAGAAPLSKSLGALTIGLAQRRLDHGDIRGATRALGSAYKNACVRSEAIAQFGEIVRRLTDSSSPDDMIIAADAVFSEPEVAASALTKAEQRQIAAAASDLGASRAVAEFLSRSSLDAAEKALFNGVALARAGHDEEARKVITPILNEPQGAELFLKMAPADGDVTSTVFRSAVEAVDPASAAGFLWRIGDLKALLSMSIKGSLTPASARWITLAHLSEGKSPPRVLLPATSDHDGAAALFEAAPDPLGAKPSEIQSFTLRQKKAIAFLLRTLSDE